MTDKEKLLVTALRNAWSVLNAIRARDGTPYHRDDRMSYFGEDYFDTLVEECGCVIEAATGEPPKPWPFEWERKAAFIESLMNPPEPSDALRRAAEIYLARLT